MSPTGSATTPRWRAGRVTFNPLKHVDPFGTIILPAMLILLRSPFLFGYAKPVPVNFGRLEPAAARHGAGSRSPGRAPTCCSRSSRRCCSTGSVWCRASPAEWLAENLVHSIQINAVLCVFNMLPLPPLDGGRVAVGLLPRCAGLPAGAARALRHADPAAVLFVIPYIGEQTGHRLQHPRLADRRAGRGADPLRAGDHRAER